ncbi:hypothetical protein AMTR_s00047p00200470 [Amborella trichopoda]|uniref:Uncharacterized protein n=1 Tax=Amborella trichopoda TaxID=13333 RepID=U5CWY3_AMBTC|nr:hypothetical protein AMTR_s00047p00200470 [Amborella trichopoda]
MGGGVYCLKEHLAWRERDVEEVGRGYENPIDNDEDQEAEFEAQIKRARIASLQEPNYRQMEMQEMYGRRDSASTIRQPQQPIVPVDHLLLTNQ